MKRFAILTAAASLAGTMALAGHPYETGDDNSNGVAKQAVDNGTLHPGHVAIYGTGKGDPREGKANMPAAEYHDGDPYADGPGGFADTRNGK